MKLLIVSNMAHYISKGGIAGWGPTVQEIDALATLFKSIVHIGCLYTESPPPPSALPYSAGNIRFIPVPPAGGQGALAKMGILREAPLYIRAILRELSEADVVHVRCPANISLMAIVLLALVRKPKYRWVKYAGNWCPDRKEAWSYTFQRWWLNRGLHRGVVTLNGHWPDQPPHVYSFFNPSLSMEEVKIAREKALQKELAPPYRILFVGRIEEAKGVGRALGMVCSLHQQGIPVEFHLVGDGPERLKYEAWALQQGLDKAVVFHGWVPRTQLGSFYEQAHFFLFPSSASEGWPKVLSEAMAYGVVPVAGAVSSIPQILRDTEAGQAFEPSDEESFVQAMLGYIRNPDSWYQARYAGVEAAPHFTYEAYLDAVRCMFQDAWSISLGNSGGCL